MALVTVYDLLEVAEDASKEEIEKAYQRLILEYHKDPILSEEENNNNEIILNKLKLAYDILSDDEKRKRYDNELAKRRAEELIKNVSTTKTDTNELQNENTEKQIKQESTNQEPQKYSVKRVVTNQQNVIQRPNQNVNHNVTSNQEQAEYEEEYEEDEEVTLSSEEKKKLKKAAQKEFKTNLKKAQKAEEEYNRAYNEAYNDYLRKMGYSVKEPWTLKRVRNLVISLLVIFIVCALIWIIPPTRNLLIKIYEENFIVKALVDIVVMLFNAIVGAFK